MCKSFLFQSGDRVQLELLPDDVNYEHHNGMCGTVIKLNATRSEHLTVTKPMNAWDVTLDDGEAITASEDVMLNLADIEKNIRLIESL